MRFVRLALTICALLPCLATADGVHALFDLSSPQRSPYPSDRFTVVDFGNLTNRRVNLPLPDCTVQVSDCHDLGILNALDGFNPQPRLRIPFSGPIDPYTVNSSNVYLVKLGDTLRPFSGYGKVVGINQIVWDPASNTLSAESDELLDQHSVYVLIVTNDVRDAQGARLRTSDFGLLHRGHTVGRADAGDVLYRAALLAALVAAKAPHGKVAAASVFTTRSTTATLEKIRDQIKATTPAPADFMIASDGSRALFPLASSPAAVISRQTAPATFATQNVPFTLMNNFLPGTVAAIAMGRYSSKSYLTPQSYLPEVPTRTGTPQVQSESMVYFNIVIPTGVKPPGGWPVALLGHGLPGDKDIYSLVTGNSLAARGIATVAINQVGNGGGPLGTIRINRLGAPPVTLPAGGRAMDVAGTGAYDAIREASAQVPYAALSHSDSMRQAAIDLMQLVRLIETGNVDYDGDGASDLDPQRIYYFGHSWGAMYGPLLVAVEPAIRAAVFNSGGGPIGVAAGLSPISRPASSAALGARTPSLLNDLPVVAPNYGFNANAPFRNQPVVINDVPGAIAIQEFSDNSEWAQQGGALVAYAPHLRRDPLRGLQAKPVIVQYGKGDLNVPNTATTNFIRAGELQDVTTYYRTDLAFALDPLVPKNPHGVMLNAFTGPSLDSRMYGRGLQDQIATFFASDGATITDPDGAGLIFETPVTLPLSEATDFLP